MTARKVVLYILGGLGVLLIGAVVFLKVYLTDERLRTAIEPLIEDALDRDVTIERFEARLLRSFPNLSIGVQNLAIHTPERPDLASVEHLWVDVPLLPLLQSRVVVKELTLDTPRVLVEVYDDLSTNLIEFSSESSEGSTDSNAAVNEIDLEQINIVDGEIGYVHADGTVLAMSQVNSQLSATLSDVLTLAGTMTSDDLYFETGGIPYADHWKVGLDVAALVNLDEATLALESTRLRIEDLAMDISGRVDNWDSDRMDIDLALAAPEATVPALWSLLPASMTRDVQGLQGAGSIAVDATLKGILAHEEVPVLNASIKVDNGSIQYPDLPESIDALSLDAQLTNDALSITKLTAQASSASLEASGQVSDFANPHINADVRIEAILDQIERFYPLEEGTTLTGRLTANTRIEGPVSTPDALVGQGVITLSDINYASESLEQPVNDLSGQIQLTRSSARLTGFSFTSGQSDFSFDGSVENYGAWMTENASDAPLMRGRLTSDYLNVDEQLTDDTTSTGPIEVPDLRMDVIFNAKKLEYAPFVLSNSSALINLNGGVFTFEQAKADFLEGLLEGAGSFDLSDPFNPLFQGTLSISSIRASRFFKSFTSLDKIGRIGDYIEGLLDSEATLNLAMDKDLNPLLETFIAEGVFGATQGLLKGMPAQQSLAGYTGVNALNELPIQSWSHKFAISGEKLHIQDLSLNAGEFQLSLNGSQTFDGAMDYTFSLQMPESVSGALANAPIQGALQPVTQLVNTALVDPESGRIVLDLSATGAFTDPEIKLNGNMMRSRLEARTSMLAAEARERAQARLDSIENAARMRAEEELAKQKQALEDRARDTAGDLLGNVVDSSAVTTELDSLKEKGGDVLKDRLKGLLNRKKKKNND